MTKMRISPMTLIFSGALALGVLAFAPGPVGHFAPTLGKTAFAEGPSDQGQGGRGGGPGGGPGGSDKGYQGGERGGGPGVEGRVLRGAGKGGGGGGSAILGRLSMARAYMSPSFDPSKIDDPEAPLANLDAYKTLLDTGSLEVDGATITPTSTVTVEGTDYYYLSYFLSKVATAPVTDESIVKVNDMLDVTSAFTSTGISADAVATEVNTLVKLTREEEEHE